MRPAKKIPSDGTVDGVATPVRSDAARCASQELLPLLVGGADGYALFTIDSAAMEFGGH